jgi:lysine 2,3-aminomutase
MQPRPRPFADISPNDWNDWRWQLRNRLRTLPQLERYFQLSPDEREGLERTGSRLPVGITPYYAVLMDPDDPAEPLRRTHIPVASEQVASSGEAADPLAEERQSPVPGLVHRYPDRVLFLATDVCASYCRYCTRSRMVGGSGDHVFSTRQWDRQIEYIAAHPEIRDCLISGGDPLTLSSARLDTLLARLAAIPHLEFIRIGTKVPVVLPQRITSGLIEVLRRHKPVWLSIHFTHPTELTPEVAAACDSLADAGIPLGSQTVLLKGINDSPEVMRTLMHGLLKMRVRPYYLYQCDPIIGSAHFRTPVSAGLAIIASLRGHTSGYAVPQFVIDAPGGGGKIPLFPGAVIEREGGDLLLRDCEGRAFRYPEPT